MQAPKAIKLWAPTGSSHTTEYNQQYSPHASPQLHREKTQDRPAGSAPFTATTETRDAYRTHDVQPRHAPRAPEPVKGPRFEAQTTSQTSWVEKPLPERGPRGDVDSCHPYSRDPFTATTSYQNDYPAEARFNVTPLPEPAAAPYVPSNEKLAAVTTYQDTMLKWMTLDSPEDALGVETIGGAFHTILPGELARPLKRDQIFTTVADNQTEVTVKVMQRDHATDAVKCLGEMDLGGLPPRPEGTVKILVTFDIDAAGVLNVGATLMMDVDRAQRRDGPAQRVTIQLR